MKISDEYKQYFLDKEEREKFNKLYRKLLGFSRRQFRNHFFRGEPGSSGGIPPSGDDCEDFIVRALIHCYPKDRPFKIDKDLTQDLYNYIRREVSRESRLKINNLVKNEAYYKARNYYYNPFTTTPDKRENARQEMIDKQVNQAVDEIVQGFIKTINDSQLKKCIQKLAAGQIDFKNLIKKIAKNPGLVMKELIKNGWIYDSTGQRTEKAKKVNRPCKIKINCKFKNKDGIKYLFGILKMDQKLSKPQFAALYLDMSVEEYYKVTSRLRREFFAFLSEWKKGKNEELLRELGLFQDI